MSAQSERPLSHLLLERYALGELSELEAARVRERLGKDSASADRLSLIATSVELPALPISERRTAPRRRLFIPALGGAGALLVAAAAWFMVVSPMKLQQGVRSARGGGQLKGGELAIAIVSEGGGEGATHFQQGERVKVLLTCPPEEGTRYLVFVFQGAEVYTPLPAMDATRCGNRVPMGGAIALDGWQAATVCVAPGSTVSTVSRLEDLGEAPLCRRLRPAAVAP